MDGMKWVPGGRFQMGSDRFYADEAPVRSATVDGLWMDETPVTNAQFAAFVSATGHVTLAERAPDPKDYPGLLPQFAKPGSMVFTPPDHPVNLRGPPVWWSFVLGADWRHPVGAQSSIEGLERHPAVHVAFADALAFADWAGKSLPSEAEWEYAARGGLDGLDYAWGDEFEPGGVSMAKIWRGAFPWRNEAPVGLERTAPVRSYPPNPFGLYDLIGNVWEWTRDDYQLPGVASGPSCCSAEKGLNSLSLDPAGLGDPIARKVSKGGSHLCAPDYCQRYRPAARWAHPVDSTTTHLGFRCVLRDRA